MFLWFGMFMKQINGENVYSNYINPITVCSIILTCNEKTPLQSISSLSFLIKITTKLQH
jgi:hypothetical protein